MRQKLTKFMKRRISLLAALAQILASVLAIDVRGTYAAEAAVSGPGTVRAGDTITVSLTTSLTGKYGFEGDLSYSQGLTLTGTSAGMSGWKLESNGAHYVGYDDNLSNPTKSGSTLMTMTFKVGNVAAGTNINVSMGNLTITDSSAGTNCGTVSYSVSIAQPLSGNTNLSALTVDGFTLSPAFAKGTKEYSIGEVEFATSSLSVKATAEDGKSKVSVSGNSLSVGANTVTVTVTAENGAQGYYTISVTRKQDPNYVASNNANLTGIGVSTGTISPAFNPDVTEYVVYLPFESVGAAFDATGTAADAKASGVTPGNIASLVEGSNKTSVVGKAEDGTEKAYNITVYVMPSYAGAVPQIGDAPVVEPEQPSKDDTEAEKVEDKKENASTETSTKQSGVSVLATVLIAVGTAVVVGGGTFGGCYYFMVVKKKVEEEEI